MDSAVVKPLHSQAPSPTPPHPAHPGTYTYIHQTMMRDEETCDPYESLCKTPTHTYEAACAVCCGTGWARNSRSGRRGGGGLGTCLVCHGMGECALLLMGVGGGGLVFR